MARSHLTLAALAASAVDGLDVAGATRFGSAGDGEFDSALVTGRDGRHWIVRVPRSERAEAEQSADLVALRALSAGVRSRLPFAVSAYAGQAPVGGTRAVVYEFVYGAKATLGGMTVDLATSIGEAVAAIHQLPTSFVADAGLPVRGAGESHRETTSVVDRAIATGLVPLTLQERWRSAVADSALWQFSPTVINGALSAEAILASEGTVTGVLGWHALRVGDPARDLHWLLAAPGDGVADAAFAAYARGRGAVDRQLRQRAVLFAELEVARWLLHGTEVRSTEIVDDAVEMLSTLVDETQRSLGGAGGAPLAAEQLPVLGVDEVEELLERTERTGTA